MALQIAKTTYELHPTGVYTGTVYSVQFEDGDYGPRVKMIVETDAETENEDPLAVWHFMSQNFSKKSKLGKTVTGILGCKFEEIPDNFDLETLIGKKAKVVVEHTEATSGNECAKIASFFPVDGESELTPQIIQRLKELMTENRVEVGILGNFYDVDAVEKLTVTQAKEFAEKLKSGALTFTLPEPSKATDTLPF